MIFAWLGVGAVILLTCPTAGAQSEPLESEPAAQELDSQSAEQSAPDGPESDDATSDVPGADTPARSAAKSKEKEAPNASDLLRPPLNMEAGPSDAFVDALAQDADDAEGAQDERTTARDAAEEYDLGTEEVVGQKREQARSGAHFEIELGQLRALPLRTAADVMMLAPGVLTTNHGGDGHAHETFIRGFYAGEGQDIEYLVDGVPLNEVSNPHGHGYTDLFFIPPSFIESMVLTEGPFDPEQGDFAFAGTVNFHLGVVDRGLHSRLGVGNYGTRQAQLLWAPEGESEGTFAGFDLYQTDGFGENRAAQRLSTLARYTHDPGGTGLRWATSFYGYAGRYDQAGVLRQDDVERGGIGFFDTYDPAQGGNSQRALASLDLTSGPNHALFDAVSWFGLRQMRLRQNFTGFLVPTELTDEGTVYLGDLQEGRYSVLNMGSRGSYTLSRRIAQRAQDLSVGYAARYDRGRTELVRLRRRLSIPYARDFDRTFDIVNVAGWTRGQLALLPWWTLRGGLRLEGFGFTVRDLTLPAEDTDGPRLQEQTVAASGVALNPRVSTTFKLSEGLRTTASYGRGTRSIDGAALSDSELAPFAQSDQIEVGLQWSSGSPAQSWSYSAQGSYVYAYVERDQLFDPDSGRNILVGESWRHALLLNGRATYERTFDILANVGATYATTEDQTVTSPTFGEIVLLPYLPQVIARLDATYKYDMGVKLGAVPVALRTAAGFTYVPARPLPLGEFGDPFYVLNASISADLWHTTLRLEGRNLFDLRYRQSEFNYPSRFDPTRPLPTVGAPRAERHFAAGEPLTVMLLLEMDVERIFNAFEDPQPRDPLGS